MVPPNGPAFAFSTSTWIHCWSPVASANALTRSWVISSQPVVPISVPAADSSSAKVVKVRMAGFPVWCLDEDMEELTAEVIRLVPKVLLHDHLDGGLRPATIVELAAEVAHELPAADADA